MGYRTKSNVFDSGLSVVEPDDIEVIVPEQIRRITEAVQREAGDSKEVALLFKGEWNGDQFVVQRDDYIIPEQEVTGTHIDYNEDLSKYREQGYNVHLHSHPFTSGNTSFSGTDDDHSNSQFDCALLFNGSYSIVDGVVNIDITSGTRIQLDSVDITTKMMQGLPDVDVDNIEEKDVSTNVVKSNRSYRAGRRRKKARNDKQRYSPYSGRSRKRNRNMDYDYDPQGKWTRDGWQPSEDDDTELYEEAWKDPFQTALEHVDDEELEEDAPAGSTS